MTGGLTKRQAQVLRFLQTWFRTEIKGPSYEEIAAACGISSKSRVGHILRALAHRNLIRMRYRTPRSVELVEDPLEGLVEALLENVIEEDLDNCQPTEDGRVVVRASDIAALDLLLSERRPNRREAA